MPLKRSTNVIRNCITEEQKVIDRVGRANHFEQTSMAAINSMQKTFLDNARADYQKWNCEAMYPPPVKYQVDIIGTIVDAVKEGFEIFNEVKGMLPEGTLENLKIPGLPEGMQENIGKGVKIFNQAKEVFE